MLCNLVGCANHKDFKLQELIIRFKIVSVVIRCKRWREISNIHKEEMKTYFLNALIGINNIDKLVKLKRKIKYKEV